MSSRCLTFKKSKMIQYYFVILISLSFTLNVWAQTSKLSVENNSRFKDRLSGVRVGFFGDNVFHPGLKLGTSYILKEKEKSRRYLLSSSQNKRRSQLSIIQHLADANIGFYNHPNNHLGLFIGVGFTRMKTNTRNMQTMGWSFDINYLYRLYNIPTVEIDDTGMINEISGAGNNSLMFALSPSFGRMFGTNKGQREWQVYVKPSLQFLKYDFAFFPNIAFELGASFNLFKRT